MKRIRVNDLHGEWMKDPAYRREYEALEEEFSLTAAGLTPEPMALRVEDNPGRRG